MCGLVGIVYGIVKDQPNGLKHAEVVQQVRRRGVSCKDGLSVKVHEILSGLVTSGSITRNEVDLDRRYLPSVSKKLRVLVVDDDMDNADTNASLLEFAGHEVRTVYSGPAALQLVSDWQPNVVLLDIEMPDMNGYEVADRVRKTQRAITLVAVTGQVNRLASKEAGFDYHLTKPVEEQKLLEMVEFGTYPHEISHRDRFLSLREEFA